MPKSVSSRIVGKTVPALLALRGVPRSSTHRIKAETICRSASPRDPDYFAVVVFFVAIVAPARPRSWASYAWRLGARARAIASSALSCSAVLASFCAEALGASLPLPPLPPGSPQ